MSYFLKGNYLLLGRPVSPGSQCPDAERPHDDDLRHAAPRLPVAALEHVVGRDLGRHRARGPRLVLVRELRLGNLHHQCSYSNNILINSNVSSDLVPQELTQPLPSLAHPVDQQLAGRHQALDTEQWWRLVTALVTLMAALWRL